ncbi:putative thiamin pyrophosphokinase 1, partial [Operophtera brumata]
SLRITVDGGTKQWDRYLGTLSPEEQQTLTTPDLITGDFDSITQEILEKYKKKGCKVIPLTTSLRITVDGGTKQWDRYLGTLSPEEQQTLTTPDLITGDFDSITQEILEKYKKKGCKVDHIVAISQSSGRLDHILGNIQTLYIDKEKRLTSPDTKLYMISDDAVSWLLDPGIHEIAVPEETRKYSRAWCSLVPIGETCDSVTTSGLKWNL